MRAMVGMVGFVAVGLALGGCSAEADGEDDVALGGTESDYTATTETMTGRYTIIQDRGADEANPTAGRDSAGRVVVGAQVTFFEAGVAKLDGTSTLYKQYGFMTRDPNTRGQVPSYSVGRLIRRNVPIDQPKTDADKAKLVLDTDGKPIPHNAPVKGHESVTRADLWNAYSTTNMIELALDPARPHDTQVYLVRGKAAGPADECLGAKAGASKQCGELTIAGPVAAPVENKCAAGTVRMFNAGGFCLPVADAAGGSAAKWSSGESTWKPTHRMTLRLDLWSQENGCNIASYYNDTVEPTEGVYPDFTYVTPDTRAIRPGLIAGSEPSVEWDGGKDGLATFYLSANVYKVVGGKVQEHADKNGKKFFLDALRSLQFDGASRGGADFCGLRPSVY